MHSKLVRVGMGLGVCLVGGVLIGCPIPVSKPISPPEDRCPGTAKTLSERCSCHPRDAVFIQRVAVLDLGNIAKNAAKNCANGDISVDIYAKKVVQASAKLCIEQSQEIDAESRRTLLKELDKIDEEVKHRELEVQDWRACYTKWVQEQGLRKE